MRTLACRNPTAPFVVKKLFGTERSLSERLENEPKTRHDTQTDMHPLPRLPGPGEPAQNVRIINPLRERSTLELFRWVLSRGCWELRGCRVRVVISTFSPLSIDN